MNTPTSYRWTDVWTLAVTRPRVDTFTALLADPAARPMRAFLWLLVTGIVLAMVTLNQLFNDPALLSTVTGSLLENGVNVSNSEISQVLFIAALCATPFSALINVGLYGLLSLGIQLVADRSGVPTNTRGKGRQMFYLIGAIFAPLTLIATFGQLMPTEIGLIFALVIIGYQTFLAVLAAQALYSMERRAATIAVVLPTLIFYVLQVLLAGQLLG